MSDEDPRIKHLVDFAVREASRIIAQSNGTGASVDSPVYLGVINPFVVPTIEHALVTIVYGVKDREWFDAGRQYHRNHSVCEQRIQVAPTVTPEWSNEASGAYSMFFDLSDVSDRAPIPAEVRPFFSELAAQIPVRDALFASRFPLVAVNADCAMETARIIAGYLAQAKAEGWTIGSARALVDDWRNEYELTKDGEKTVMRFDMRPCLANDSRLSIVALSLIAGTSKLESVICNYEKRRSWPEAFAAAGISFVDTSPSQLGKATRLPKPRAVDGPSKERSPFREKAIAWYYHVNSQPRGPLSEAELIHAIKDGTVTGSTVVSAVCSDGKKDSVCYRIDSLMEREVLPLVRRELSALPPGASENALRAREVENRFGKPFSEFSPTECKVFTLAASRDGLRAATEKFRGTDAESLIRDERRRRRISAIGVAIGFCTVPVALTSIAAGILFSATSVAVTGVIIAVAMYFMMLVLLRLVN